MFVNNRKRIPWPSLAMKEVTSIEVCPSFSFPCGDNNNNTWRYPLLFAPVSFGLGHSFILAIVLGNCTSEKTRMEISRRSVVITYQNHLLQLYIRSEVERRAMVEKNQVAANVKANKKCHVITTWSMTDFN